jgi:hypothetical protein
MNNVNVISIDLAKNVIQVCKISQHGELLSNKAISRQKLKELLANASPSIVAMEGCGSCHYWGRFAKSHGHEVRIVSPKRVKGFLTGQKTDANDALAIAAAVMQLGMKCCPVKEIDQQSLQTLETSRKFLDKESDGSRNQTATITTFQFPLGPLAQFEGNVTSREQIGILFSLEDSLQLVGTTGRMIRTDKRGAILINLPLYLKGYRLTGNNGCNKTSSLKSFTPHNSLKSDVP